MKEVRIRRMEKTDRPELLGILRRTGVFSRGEIKIAAELMDSFVERKKQRDYIIHVADAGGKTAGYVCFGPTPCTDNTYDIYWIAVDPDLHGLGIGGRLLAFAERKISSLGGKMIVVETSSTSRYRDTRRFYLAKQYKVGAIIKDFYRRRDNKIIFIKRIARNFRIRENGHGKMEKTAA